MRCGSCGARSRPMPSGPMSACRSTPYSCTRRPFRWKPSSAVNSAARTPNRTFTTSTASPADTPISAVYRFGLSTSHSFGFGTTLLTSCVTSDFAGILCVDGLPILTIVPEASRNCTQYLTSTSVASGFLSVHVTRTVAASFATVGVVTNTLPGTTCTAGAETSRTAR